MKNKLAISNTLLLLFILTENGCLFYFYKIGWLTQGKNAWSLFLSSFFFGITLIYKFYNAGIEETKLKRRKSDIATYIILPIIFVSGLVWLYFLYDDLFTRLKIDPGYSDIIPTIQILCRRLVSGQYPYDVISQCGYTQQVTYLSMHWLPFAIAELLKIDYRWIGSAIWCLASILLFVRSLKTPNIYLRSLLPLLILGSNFVLYFNNLGIIGVTIEIMISGYYMLLISSLNQKNAIVQGLFFSFCILSRFSLVLWLPLYAFVLLVTKNWKQLFIAVGVVIFVGVVSYVIPFMSKDWSILTRGYKTYDSGAMFEWNRMQTHGPDHDKPLMLFSGTGFAYYFYTRFTNLDVLSRIKICQKFHLYCSILVVIIMAIWYWFKREKINFKIFLMGSFKIYLSVFLFLIQVPYEYLMIVGNFVTIAIFCEQARYLVKYKDPNAASSDII